jgi:hypothetical protein
VSHCTTVIKLDLTCVPLGKLLVLKSIGKIAALDANHKTMRVEFRAMYNDSDIRVVLFVEHSNKSISLVLTPIKSQITTHLLTKSVLGGSDIGYMFCQKGIYIASEANVKGTDETYWHGWIDVLDMIWCLRRPDVLENSCIDAIKITVGVTTIPGFIFP